jgi:hypothetical protein
LANIISGIGVFMMLVGYGYQNAAKDHPEVISNWGTAADWGQIAGVLITLGGLATHTLQGKTNEAAAAKTIDAMHTTAITAVAATHAGAVAAVDAAAIAPPVDPQTGRPGSLVTIAAAIEQVVNEGNYKMAAALVKAVEENPL